MAKPSAQIKESFQRGILINLPLILTIDFSRGSINPVRLENPSPLFMILHLGLNQKIIS